MSKWGYNTGQGERHFGFSKQNYFVQFNEFFSAHFQDAQPNITKNGPCNYTAAVSFQTDKSGIFNFSAGNKFGSTDGEGNVMLSDLGKEFGIVGANEEHFVGDNESVTCGAAIYKYSTLDWYINGILINNSTRKFMNALFNL